MPKIEIRGYTLLRDEQLEAFTPWGNEHGVHWFNGGKLGTLLSTIALTKRTVVESCRVLKMGYLIPKIRKVTVTIDIEDLKERSKDTQKKRERL